jgi:hypothetical protein
VGVAELAHAGQPGQQVDLGMLAQPVADGLIEFGHVASRVASSWT